MPAISTDGDVIRQWSSASVRWRRAVHQFLAIDARRLWDVVVRPIDQVFTAHGRLPALSLRFSLIKIASACLRDWTIGPFLLPLCSFPALNFVRTRELGIAVRPYLVRLTPVYTRKCERQSYAAHPLTLVVEEVRRIIG
jgi:hypothetical protein